MEKQIDAHIVESRIFFTRGQRVMMDTDLAELYGATTKNLNKAVRRNLSRFPLDFMFKLTNAELINLGFQFGTSRWGGRRYLPYVFTEQGVTMLSSVLHSPRAVRVNIAIMRAFVRLRQVLASDKDLAKRVERLEKKIDLHETDIRLILQDIRKLLNEPKPDIPLQKIPKIDGFSK